MKLFVVGLGPGGLDQITPAAIDAIEQSDVIAGYTVYVDLIRQRFADKTFLTTPMKQEVDRCRMAIERNGQGKKRVDGVQRRRGCLRHGRADL